MYLEPYFETANESDKSYLHFDSGQEQVIIICGSNILKIDLTLNNEIHTDFTMLQSSKSEHELEIELFQLGVKIATS